MSEQLQAGVEAMKYVLMSLMVDHSVNAHCYVQIADLDPKLLSDAMSGLMVIVEKKFGTIRMPIVLQTDLETAENGAIVKEIFCKHFPEEGKRMLGSENIFSVFCLLSNEPDDKKLMDLH
jgi:hypothetical protein